MPKQWPVAALTDSWPDDHCRNTITNFLDGRIGAKRACVTILCGRKMTDTRDLTLSNQEYGWMERLDFKVPRLTDCYEIIENDIKKQSTVKEDCRVGTLASLSFRVLENNHCSAWTHLSVTSLSQSFLNLVRSCWIYWLLYFLNLPFKFA